MRITIAGFQHETNSFAPSKAGISDFEMADSWPGLLLGDAVLDGTRGMNLPVAGFAEAAATDRDIDLLPILWCAAEPSGPVTDDAFEQISERIVDAVGHADPLDGVYLDLHGAMITESFDDGEGELLQRLRRRIGDDIPIVISLDLHANVSDAMVQLADAVCIFRTYPHLDMAETGKRAFIVLLHMIISGTRPARSFRQIPFLIPLPAQHTMADPARALYASLTSFEQAPDHYAEIAMGFTAGDTPHTGASILSYAKSQQRADDIADGLLATIVAAEKEFDDRLLSAKEAVAIAMSTNTDRPVVIADVQDNPGAGGTSDTTGLLRELVDAGAKDAILGLLHDPETAKAAHDAGIGAVIKIPLGGKSGLPGQAPFVSTFRVDNLSDGRCVYTGEMYAGGVAMLGPTAVLSVAAEGVGVQVVVTSIRNQCLDLAHFTHIGLDPKQAKIVVVKSTAHFRADFEPIATAVLCAEAPGANPCRLDGIPFKRLRPGLRW
ncbi:MAG: M81 family metallopeptidase [Pseudomonadota bacterium]